MHPNSQATGLCVTLVWWGFCTPSPTKCHENNKFPRRDLQMNLLSSLAIKMYSVKSIHLCDPQNRRCIEANRSLYIWQHRTSRETHTAVASKAIKDRSKHNSQGINTWCKLHGMALRCVGLCELCGGNLRPMQIQRTRRSGGKMLDQKTKKTKQTVPVPFRKRNILSKLLLATLLKIYWSFKQDTYPDLMYSPAFHSTRPFSILSLIFGGNHRRASPTPRERHQCFFLMQPSCNRPEMTYQMRCNLFYLQYTATEFDYATEYYKINIYTRYMDEWHATFFFLQ